METAQIIARILGPVLAAVSSSELLHQRIWKDVPPWHVHLNGLVLFAGGVTTISFHHDWRWEPALMVTLAGWLMIVAGAFRLYLPEAKQSTGGAGFYALTSGLTLYGLALCAFGYLAGA